MVSLPAALAVRIYGAEISAADDMAVAATNCRRESFFHDIWRSSLVSQSRWKSRCYFSFRRGRPKQALHGGMGFRCEDQIRIAGVCREIRCLAALELTLWSSLRQDDFFCSP